MTQTVTAYITKNFTDAGTEQRFTKGEVRPIDAGAFGNYAAGKSARLATEEEIKAAAEAAAPIAASAETKTETKKASTKGA